MNAEELNRTFLRFAHQFLESYEHPKLLDSTIEYGEMTKNANPSGDGNAWDRILEVINFTNK